MICFGTVVIRGRLLLSGLRSLKKKWNDDQYDFATTAAEGFFHFFLLVTDQDPQSSF